MMLVTFPSNFAFCILHDLVLIYGIVDLSPDFRDPHGVEAEI
jgi:hypothetical protein